MFADWIRDCRREWSRGRAGWLGMIGLGSPAAELDLRETIPESLRPHYLELARHGAVVWGHTAQANRQLYSPGYEDLPCNTIYSPSPYFDSRPDRLAEVADAVYALKDTGPADPELADVAATITDEFNGVEKQRLPERLTDGREVYLAWTIVHRPRLPEGVLSDRLLPLVIAPGKTRANMILPLRYWARPLVDHWGRLDDLLRRRTENRRGAADGAEPVAEAPPVALAEEALAEREARLIDVTPRAARMIRKLARQCGMAEPYYLAVAVTQTEKGPRHRTDLAPTWDRQREVCIECGEVRVLIPKDQVSLLAGAVVDFRESIYGTGFLVRNPNV
jgi:iron-sulfur cluster assembly protein